MSGNWLDISSTSNRYIQTYVKGFVDMSGGNLVLRNNNILVQSGDISVVGRLLFPGTTNIPLTSTTFSPALSASTNYGTSWSMLNSATIPTSGYFTAISESSTGQYIFTGIYGGSAYLSNNYGSSWLQPTGLLATANYNCTSVSATGQFMLTGTYGSSGSVYISTNYGTSFAVASGPSVTGNYKAVTLSSEGRFMHVCTYGGAGYYSSNYGTSFTSNVTPLSVISNFNSINVSGIGKYVLTCVSGGSLYRSSNFGSAYTQTPAGVPTTAIYTGVAQSSTGQYMLASTNPGAIYASTNYGTNWTTVTNGISTSGNYNNVSVSSTGQYMLICANSSILYLSKNFGGTFTTVNSSSPYTTYNYSSATISETGTYMLVSMNNGSNAGTIYASIPVTVSRIALSVGAFITSTGLSTTDAYITGNIYSNMLTTGTTITPQSTTLPYMNIKGYVGFSDASGSSAGTVPRALIEIQSTGGYNASSTYNAVTSTSTTIAAITTQTTTPYSLYTTGSILCGTEIDIASDRRIKNNIMDVLDVSALDVVRQLKPKRYNYVDTVTRGKTPVWGYIAQDVASVLDYAVKTTTDFIPNIYQVVSVDGNNISLAKQVDSVTLTIMDASDQSVVQSEQSQQQQLIITTSSFEPNSDGSPIRIKLYDSNYIARYTTITSIIDEFTFIVEDIYPDTEMFLFGQEVSDFHVLDKMAVYTIATAALQELDTEHEQSKQNVILLQQNNSALRATIETMQQQMQAILQRLESGNVNP